MMRIQNPLGRELDRIKKESKRYKTGGVDSADRIREESQRLSQSDVVTDPLRRAKKEQNGQRG